MCGRCAVQPESKLHAAKPKPVFSVDLLRSSPELSARERRRPLGCIQLRRTLNMVRRTPRSHNSLHPCFCCIIIINRRIGPVTWRTHATLHTQPTHECIVYQDTPAASCWPWCGVSTLLPPRLQRDPTNKTVQHGEALSSYNDALAVFCCSGGWFACQCRAMSILLAIQTFW